MNPRKCAALSLLLLCFAPAARADDASATLRTLLDADHAKLVAAETKGNVLAFDALADTLFAPTFTIKPPHGGATMDYTQYLAAEKDFMANVKGLKDTFTTQSVKVKRDTAEEMGTRTETGTKADPNGVVGPKGKTHAISETSTYRMHWAKYADGWKMASVDVLSDTLLVDGAPFHALPPPRPAVQSRPSASTTRRRGR